MDKKVECIKEKLMRSAIKNIRALILITGSVIVFLIGIAQNAEAVKYYFTTQTVDSGGDVGYFSSLALDSSGKAYISYQLGEWYDLKYATNASGTWVTQAADNSFDHVGYFTSIALDSANKAYISYSDDTNGDLKYATNASGTWVMQAADSAGNVGSYTSLALDSANKAYISYYDFTNGDLKYATNASGTWVTQAADSAGIVGSYTSIALDIDKKAYISYFDQTNFDLKYATNASGTWVTQTVDSFGSVGYYTSLALDSSNKAYIIYSDDTNGDLKYATNASGTWVTQAVDSASWAGFSSIALDSSNKAYISYYDGANLKFATNASGSWVKQTVDSVGGIYSSYTSIALDIDKKAYISYYDSNNGDLKYAIMMEAGNTSLDKDGVLITLTDESGGVSGYTITYDDITADGRTRVLVRTTATSGSNSFLSDPEVGYMLDDTVRNITIEDAAFSTAGGKGFWVRIPYNEVAIPGGFTESQLRLFHYLGSGNVEDITVSVNTASNYVLGFATSFSDFGVGVNPEPATLLLLGSALLGLLPLRKKLTK